MLQTPEDIDQARFLKAARNLPSRRIQEEISEKTGISTSNVSEYLNCIKYPSRNFLEKFYKAYKLEEEDFTITSEDIGFVEFVKNNKFKKRSEFKTNYGVSSSQPDRDRLLALEQLAQVQRVLIKDLDAVSVAMSNVLSSKSDSWQQDAQVVEDLLQKYSGVGKGKSNKGRAD